MPRVERPIVRPLQEKTEFQTLIDGLAEQIKKGDLRIDQAIAIAEGYLDTTKDLWTEEDELWFETTSKGAM